MYIRSPTKYCPGALPRAAPLDPKGTPCLPRLGIHSRCKKPIANVGRHSIVHGSTNAFRVVEPSERFRRELFCWISSISNGSGYANPCCGLLAMSNKRRTQPPHGMPLCGKLENPERTQIGINAVRARGIPTDGLNWMPNGTQCGVRRRWHLRRKRLECPEARVFVCCLSRAVCTRVWRSKGVRAYSNNTLDAVYAAENASKTYSITPDPVIS